MKKIRSFPFGYRYVQGTAVADPSEAALIQTMYERYLQGESIQKLTEYAEQSGIPYRENANGWNKNMVSRILEDERYWNGGQYPPIVHKDVAEKAVKFKQSKTAPRSKLQWVQKKISCPVCGNTVTRNSKRKPKIFWDCKQCGRCIGPVTDDELSEIITEEFLKLCREPATAELDRITGVALSMQAVRLTHEIDQMMDRREIDKEKVLSLILECAAEKYKACHSEDDYLTLKIRKLLEGHTEDDKLDQELFRQVVDKVILQPDCSVKLRLINGKTL